MSLSLERSTSIEACLCDGKSERIGSGRPVFGTNEWMSTLLRVCAIPVFSSDGFQPVQRSETKLGDDCATAIFSSDRVSSSSLRDSFETTSQVSGGGGGGAG